jgi:hypothetical protein
VEVIEKTGLLEDLFYEHLFYHPNLSKSKSEGKSKTKESRAAVYQLL